MTVSNPVADFAAMLTAMGQFRNLLPIDKTLGEDLAMLTTEGVVVGLRSPWVRRVALPAWQVHKVLSTDAPKRERGAKAIEILTQCKDDALVATFAAYIGIHFLTPAAQTAGVDPQRSLLS